MKKKKILLWVVILLLVVAGGLGGYHYWYQSTHVFVDEIAYEKDMTYLDLRGTGLPLEHYLQLREQLPDCEIRYDLPFQGEYYADDTSVLTISSLTEEEVVLLDYLPELETVNAEGCRDYDALLALRQRRPECRVHYTVTILGQEYGEDTKNLSFSGEEPGFQELMDAFALLPELETVWFDQPQMAAEELRTLQESWPEVDIRWEKDIFGTTYASDVTEIDLSGMYFESLDQVEAALAWFPSLEKVIMSGCGYDKRNLFDNETMAAFREKMRPEYKVVWSIWIYGLEVRTDDTYFMPVKYGYTVYNYQVQQLIYCEDMLCVDVGHMAVTQLDWVTGMPHLKYLIVADGPLIYIEPLSTCKELIYLELFMTEVSDFTPLLGCTALEDLNVSMTNGDPMVFKDMPWLKNLWINCLGVSRKEHNELQEALPNTKIVSDYGIPNGGGWRYVDNYFDMRDLLGMFYTTW